MREPLSFDAHDENGNPRVFAGMHRPPLEEVVRPFREGATILSTLTRAIIYPVQVADLWRSGEFDAPLYYTEPPEAQKEKS